MDNQRLSGLENNRVANDVRLYSRFLRLFKFILPVGAMAIIILLFLWPKLSAIQTEPLTENDIKALKQAETENHLISPTYNTIDANGKPVSIHAQEAKQNRSDNNSVYLSEPSATMNDDGNLMTFEAKSGVYNQSDKILQLNDTVILKDSKNNILETGDLTADMNKNTATSQSPAKLTTEKGYIEGQSVIIDQQNQTTIFNGPAKAVIN